jgi:hypothetical protein
MRYVKILVIRRRVFPSIPLYLPLSKREHGLLRYSAPSPRRGRGGGFSFGGVRGRL